MLDVKEKWYVGYKASSLSPWMRFARERQWRNALDAFVSACEVQRAGDLLAEMRCKGLADIISYNIMFNAAANLQGCKMLIAEFRYLPAAERRLLQFHDPVRGQRRQLC